MKGELAWGLTSQAPPYTCLRAPLMGYIMAEEAYSSLKWYAGLKEFANAIRSFRPLQGRSKALTTVSSTRRSRCAAGRGRCCSQWVNYMLGARPWWEGGFKG